MQVGIDARSSTPAVGLRKPKIRIVLVEDHAILREGLKALIEIESDFDIVGEFGSVEDCLAGLAGLQPDLLLTDLALPGRSGIELLAEIQRLCPLTRKLVLTAHENEEYIRAALNAGANGYVLKDANSAELMLAIRTVSMGQQFLCKAIASKILSGYLSGHAPGDQRAAAPAATRFNAYDRRANAFRRDRDGLRIGIELGSIFNVDQGKNHFGHSKPRVSERVAFALYGSERAGPGRPESW